MHSDDGLSGFALTSRMDPHELLAAIERGAAPAILDVRSRWEYTRGHVPGAVHIPFWTLPLHVSAVKSLRDEPVVVYCGQGPRAWLAGALLRLFGFRHVLQLTGHMSAWTRAALPRTAGPRP